MELPDGWKITTANNTSDLLTSSPLLIFDANGHHVLTIPEPVFFDNDGLESDGLNMVEGKYLLGKENDRWTVTTLVPVEWLKDANTKYPISIDPTLVIPGTTGGWQSPNNWVDNPGFVFLGVCCGNLTHRAWIKFNTTAIPDGSCISSVELQMSVTTVVSNNPELVFINDVTGAFGPYGGIVPAAYNDFGNGLYSSFTITGVGVYGYYTLGATANTLLQAQLPVNWFQVGLMFNNEPSTDYKIINGTSSNLRVTYPCALPVELLSFDGQCNNGQVNLNWVTASQSNNDYFTIERSTDGIDNKIIGTITGAGNSSQILHYSFVDPQPPEGTSYYSIKQTDFNGHSEYLNLIAVSCHEVPEFTIYPNPGSGIFSITGAEQDNEIIITDVLGQIVFQSKIMAGKTEIDLSSYLDGIYFVQISSKKGSSSKKIILNK